MPTSWSTGVYVATSWSPTLCPEGHAAAVKLPRGSRVAARAAKDNVGSYKFAFPETEEDLLSQMQTSVQKALSDGHVLLEVEMPPVKAVGVGVGDSIAISEYNANMKTLRKFVELWTWLGQAERVRVFFPDAGEADIAMNGIGKSPASGQWEQGPTFHDWAGHVDYLLVDGVLNKSAMKMYGYRGESKNKKTVSQEAEIDDSLFVVGYPYDGVDETVAIMELWDQFARPTIIFNGNLDAVRTGFHPFGKAKRCQKEFVPKVETAYYIHKFRAGNAPGLLFRAYPGNYLVLRALPGGGLECCAEYEQRPLLKDVALQFFSGGLQSSAVVQGDAQAAKELSSDSSRYYALLGVERGASYDDLVKGYRVLARKHHPDVGGDLQVFYEVNKAYSVLRDTEKRALYDVYGEQWVNHQDDGKAEDGPGRPSKRKAGEAAAAE